MSFFFACSIDTLEIAFKHLLEYPDSNHNKHPPSPLPAYYQWPVKIPDNVPSCTEKNKCLFVWTWTANILPQWYMNCADIRLTGIKNGRRPSKSIQIVDFRPHRMRVTAAGDGTKHRSSTGPSRKEINDNMNGRY